MLQNKYCWAVDHVGSERALPNVMIIRNIGSPGLAHAQWLCSEDPGRTGKGLSLQLQPAFAIFLIGWNTPESRELIEASSF
jgi:hypothetical protein